MDLLAITTFNNKMSIFAERLRNAKELGYLENKTNLIQQQMEERMKFEQDQKKFEDTVDANFPELEKCFSSGKRHCTFRINFSDLERCKRTRQLLKMPVDPVDDKWLDYSDMKPRKGYHGLLYTPVHTETPFDQYGDESSDCVVRISIPSRPFAERFMKASIPEE